MPIKLEENAEAHLLIAHFTGKLTREDYEKFVPEADTFIEAHHPVRMLLDITGLEGWDLGAAWDDLKFGVKHHADITRLAIIGDQRWERLMAALWKPFTKAKIQSFPTTQRTEAHNWVLA